jgi:hypothetical protein
LDRNEKGKVKACPIKVIYSIPWRGGHSLKITHKQSLLLTLFVGLLTVGILEAEYGIVRSFVRFICTSCIGLG